MTITAELRAEIIEAIRARVFDGRWYITPHPVYRDLVPDKSAWDDYRLWLVHEAADAAIGALTAAPTDRRP